MLVVGNGRLITRDSANTYIENGAVLINGNVIETTGTTEEIRRMYPAAEYIDAAGGVIMPAFINVHEHIYSAFARGLSVKGYNPKGFLDILDGMGYWNVYALVADPNPASERIHARLGFTCVGREPHTAYKFGWLGLSTWWLPLRRGNEKPEPTHPLTQEQVEEILGRYQA